VYPEDVCSVVRRSCMRPGQLSNKRAKSFNHKHINCFINVLEFVGKLHIRWSSY